MVHCDFEQGYSQLTISPFRLLTFTAVLGYVPRLKCSHADCTSLIAPTSVLYFSIFKANNRNPLIRRPNLTSQLPKVTIMTGRGGGLSKSSKGSNAF